MPSKTGWIRHLTCSTTVALALAGSASTALAADGAAASSAWTCRASAGYVNIVGNGQSGHVEPIGANGDVATGADNPQCKTDGQGSPDITLGDPQQGEAVETGPRAYTAINPGLTYQQRPGASGEIEHLVLAGGGHLLTADVAQSIGLAGCAGPGAPRLYGASQVANLMVDGHAIKDPGTQQTVVDQPNLTVTLNEQTTAPLSDGKQLVQRALHVKLAQDENDYIELVVAEARVGYHGDPSALCAFPAPPVPPCPDGATRDASGGCQVVLAERMRSASARLRGHTGCVKTAFHAVVTGLGISRVVFTLDGKPLATLTKPNRGRAFSVTVDPRRLRVGIYRLLARVYFASDTNTAPRTLPLSFQSCPAILAPPRFTG